MFLYKNTNRGAWWIARDHFALTLPHGTLVYCNIRKNACSAFRRMFKRHSPHVREGEGGYAMMKRRHRVWLPQLLPQKSYPLFVYRDPIERTVSLFRNKFVDRKGGQNLARSYEALTGRNADSATLDEFVLEYVIQYDRRKLDPHLRRQSDHLVRLEYFASPLHELNENMALLLGRKFARRYFGKPANPSRSLVQEPSAEVREVIERVYAPDVEMIRAIESSNPLSVEDLPVPLFGKIRAPRNR